ncbi:hypothetical protein L3X38_045430 [Prunus dulcis]|uniref:Leucine-rich repeat-containing N-terminal plant-type domain-containing protein n=1 Tax=Prunus dulcis TaxID=3755 RepID=A0AAD4YPC3_PRUDU|nr:hypothetical protein L3X38_045430 [Prunus dulcis]
MTFLCSSMAASAIAIEATPETSAKLKPADVSALKTLYSSLNSPSQLTQWSASGDDPCGQSWKGVKCSGSRVTEFDVSNLQLSGSLWSSLQSLTALTNLDMSHNNLADSIPYSLPPIMTRLNLAANNCLMGNAVTDDYHDYVGAFQYWWTHGLISDSTYRMLRVTCDFGSAQHPSVECMRALKIAEMEQGNIVPYSIFFTRPCNSTESLKHNLRGHYPWMSRAYDPCTERYSEVYFNHPEVQRAFHANVTGIPYSWQTCSHNQLQNQVDDLFGKLSSLSTLDLSFNSLSGNLPESLSSFSSMTTMNLQNSQLTGPINVLANFPLENLNIQNNQFTGWIPEQLKNINLEKDGNTWNSGPAPPPPPGTPPASKNNGNHKSGSNGSPSKGGAGEGGKKSGIGGGGVTGIVISLLVVTGVVAFFIIKRRSRRSSSDVEKFDSQPFAPLASEVKEMKSVQTPATLDIKISGITLPVMREALIQAKNGQKYIMGIGN